MESGNYVLKSGQPHGVGFIDSSIKCCIRKYVNVLKHLT